MITRKLLLFLLLLSVPLLAQVTYSVIIPASPPGGVGGACSSTAIAYLQPLTGGNRIVTCDPSSHLWVVGGGGSSSLTPCGPTVGEVQLFASSTTLGCDAKFIWDSVNHLLKIEGAPITPFQGLYVGPDESTLPSLLQSYLGPAQVLITSAAGGATYGVGVEAFSNFGIYLGWQASGSGDNTGNAVDAFGSVDNQSIHGYGSFYDPNGFNVGRLIGYYAYSPGSGNGGTATSNIAFWAEAQEGASSNAYSFWADEQGVFRIKADNTFNSVYQAIPALYNPQFTKYTPGAANYERAVLGQWSSNIAQIGVEKGGTGTLRELQLIGQDLQIPVLAFASLGTPSNSAEAYCSDCTVTSGINDTCVGSGTGAWAQRINGVWSCRL